MNNLKKRYVIVIVVIGVLLLSAISVYRYCFYDPIEENNNYKWTCLENNDFRFTRRKTKDPIEFFPDNYWDDNKAKFAVRSVKKKNDCLTIFYSELNNDEEEYNVNYLTGKYSCSSIFGNCIELEITENTGSAFQKKLLLHFYGEKQGF